jgi:hypothetical protein
VTALVHPVKERDCILWVIKLRDEYFRETLCKVAFNLLTCVVPFVNQLLHDSVVVLITADLKDLR